MIDDFPAAEGHSHRRGDGPAVEGSGVAHGAEGAAVAMTICCGEIVYHDLNRQEDTL